MKILFVISYPYCRTVSRNKVKMGDTCVSWCEGVGLWSEGMQKCAGRDCSWKAIIFVFLFATHTLFFKINSLPTE